jgi:hypothetical protein
MIVGFSKHGTGGSKGPIILHTNCRNELQICLFPNTWHEDVGVEVLPYKEGCIFSERVD